MPTNQPPAERLDARLGALLDVEQRLARRLAGAEAEAARRVAAARADGAEVAAQARRAEAEQRVALEAEVRAAEVEALAALEAEHRAVLARLAAVTDEALERLARHALARALGDEAVTP